MIVYHCTKFELVFSISSYVIQETFQHHQTFERFCPSLYVTCYISFSTFTITITRQSPPLITMTQSLTHNADDAADNDVRNDHGGGGGGSWPPVESPHCYCMQSSWCTITFACGHCYVVTVMWLLSLLFLLSVVFLLCYLLEQLYEGLCKQSKDNNYSSQPPLYTTSYCI